MSRSRYRSTSHDRLRIVGVDDGPFPADRGARRHALLAAVLFLNLRILSVRVGRIEVDGSDATRVLTSLLKTMMFDVVMLSGISFGGFNLVDIRRLAHVTRKPVIAVSREKPNNVAVRKALQKHFGDWKERWRIVRNAGPLYSCRPLRSEPKLYFEVKGASPAFARNAIASAATISRLPDPIRVAGILARGLTAAAVGATLP